MSVDLLFLGDAGVPGLGSTLVDRFASSVSGVVDTGVEGALPTAGFLPAQPVKRLAPTSAQKNRKWCFVNTFEFWGICALFGSRTSKPGSTGNLCRVVFLRRTPLFQPSGRFGQFLRNLSQELRRSLFRLRRNVL